MIGTGVEVHLKMQKATDIKISDNQENCDIFTGEWIPNPNAPYYTNTTYWAIHEHQNCIKYGWPDFEFMKWRWKPDGCDLQPQVFNPFQFLDIVRDRSLAFVGDSVGRNQMQSMICLLSRELIADIILTTEFYHFWSWNRYNEEFVGLCISFGGGCSEDIATTKELAFSLAGMKVSLMWKRVELRGVKGEHIVSRYTWRMIQS